MQSQMPESTGFSSLAPSPLGESRIFLLQPLYSNFHKHLVTPHHHTARLQTALPTRFLFLPQDPLCMFFRWLAPSPHTLWDAGLSWTPSLGCCHTRWLPWQSLGILLLLPPSDTLTATHQQLQPSSARLLTTCVLHLDIRHNSRQSHTSPPSAADLVIQLGIPKGGGGLVLKESGFFPT